MRNTLGIIGILVALLLVSCGELGVAPTIDEANGALALAGNEILSQIGPAANVVSRGPDPTIDGTYGGYATFEYVYSSDPVTFTGSILFSDFRIEDSDANIFTINGEVELVAVFDSDVMVTYNGNVQIDKNGGRVHTYTAAVEYRIVVEAESISVTATGTINGIDIGGTEVYSFPVS